MLASSGDLEAFADALPDRPAVRTAPVTPPPPTGQATLATLRGQLADALGGLALPDSAAVLGGSVRVEAETAEPAVEVTVAAPRRLSAETRTVIARQLSQSLGLPAQAATLRQVVLDGRALPDSVSAPPLAALLGRHRRLAVTLSGDSAAVAGARSLLAQRGVAAGRVRAVRSGAPGAQLTVRPDSLR